VILYKVENKITGEIYIGQTKKALCERKRDHIYEAFKRGMQDKFHSALREFGRLAFTWSIISEYKSYKKLTEAESEAIQFYKSIKYGYNTQIRHDASANKRICKKNYKNGFIANRTQ
jgi:hypothetical protein